MKNLITSVPDKTFFHILAGCGLFLVLAELYKQLFLYFVINGHQYDWWYFPFQLCSLPMYLCLLLPILKASSLRRIICTFMQDFNLLGGAMALIQPEGFLNIHWSLSVHGYLWHILLILIGLLIGLGGHSDFSLKGYFRTLPLFILFCMTATAINVLAPGHGRANMFYISPYYPSTQILFHEIALKFGILAGNLSYLLAVCLGAFLVHWLMSFLHRRIC